ncbi:hypothetical protein MRX96_048547 [Rhipicephalus microplus]
MFPMRENSCQNRLGGRASRVGGPVRSATHPATATQRTGQGPDSRRRLPSILTHQTNWTAWNADDFELTDNIGPSDSTPRSERRCRSVQHVPHLRPSVPHTPWFRVIDARRKKVACRGGLRDATSHIPPTRAPT